MQKNRKRNAYKKGEDIVVVKRKSGVELMHFLALSFWLWLLWLRLWIFIFVFVWIRNHCKHPLSVFNQRTHLWESVQSSYAIRICCKRWVKIDLRHARQGCDSVAIVTVAWSLRGPSTGFRLRRGRFMKGRTRRGCDSNGIVEVLWSVEWVQLNWATELNWLNWTELNSISRIESS